VKLVTFKNRVGDARLGLLSADGILDLRAAAEAQLGEAPAWSASTLAFLQGGQEARDAAEAVASGAGEGPDWVPVDGTVLLAPLPRPESLRDAMSFERHVVQATRVAGLGKLGRLDALLERRVGPRRSLAGRLNSQFYVRPPHYRSNERAVVGPEADVPIPSYCQKFDYELEWGVFIGKAGRDIPADRAREHIAGYTIFNDFSARDVQLEEMKNRLGPAKGKNFDGGNAMGPCLVTPDELADPYDLTMTARVNGEEWSRGSTGEAYWKFEQLIAYISQDETLYPGDFIGSGTCSGEEGMGCGLEQGRFLSAGDVVELEVEGIGVLRNRVVASAGPGRGDDDA
jgi:2-keto-4-pentenoate hydratase/2-oxohepta-3-ene-1,7-dioic acid hydratase in catechol pathway